MNLDTYTRRFWAQVDQTGGPEACWPWMGRRVDGYGRAKRGDAQLAHVVALVLTVGDPPGPGWCCLHSCDNPPCCNPGHLRWGTRKDNAEDRLERGKYGMPGATHPNAKLTETQVAEIRTRYIPRHPQHGAEAIARELGMTPSPIRRIVNGKGWL